VKEAMKKGAGKAQAKTCEYGDPQLTSYIWRRVSLLIVTFVHSLAQFFFLNPHIWD